MKKKVKFSLFGKIILLAVVCVVVPLLTGTVLLTNTASKSILETAENTLVTLSVKEATAITDILSGQKVLTEAVATNADVVNAAVAFDTDGSINPKAQASLAEYLGGIQTQASGLYENFFVTVGSTGYADCLGNATLHDVSEEFFYQECLANGFFYGSNVSPVTGNPVYVIAYAIKDPKTGKIIGSVNNSIDVGVMSERLLQDNVYQIGIIDFDGNIIASQDKSSILSYNIKDSNPDNWNGMLAAGTGFFSYEDPFTNETTYTGFAVSSDVMCQVSQRGGSFEEQKMHLVNVSIMVVVLCVIIATAVAIWLAKRLSKPLNVANNQVSGLIEDINNGQGNLDTVIKVHSTDESGALVDCINEFIATLNRVISSVRLTSDKVKLNAESTGSIIGEASTSSMNISAVMEELSASMEEVSASANEMTQSMESILNTVDGVSDESRKGSDLVERIKVRASEIKANTSKNKQGIVSAIDDKKQTLDEAISESRKVDQISDLTNDILSIASQTNLLALNASIEAARAGEAGKGFAVVADEIRKLAESSRGTANNIQAISSDVVNAVNRLVEASGSMMELVAETINRDYNGFEEAADTYYADAEQIDEMIEKYTEGMTNLQNTVALVAQAINDVSTTMKQCSEGVSDATDNVNNLVDSMNYIKDGAREDIEGIETLQKEISIFK